MLISLEEEKELFSHELRGQDNFFGGKGKGAISILEVLNQVTKESREGNVHTFFEENPFSRRPEFPGPASQAKGQTTLDTNTGELNPHHLRFKEDLRQPLHFEDLAFLQEGFDTQSSSSLSCSHVLPRHKTPLVVPNFIFTP